MLQGILRTVAFWLRGDDAPSRNPLFDMVMATSMCFWFVLEHMRFLGVVRCSLETFELIELRLLCLLYALYDVVVTLDTDLRVAARAPKLDLLLNTRDAQGTRLTDFMGPTDRGRFLEFVARAPPDVTDGKSNPTPAQETSLNVHLQDGRGSWIQVQLFHTQFQNFGCNQVEHLIGICEVGDSGGRAAGGEFGCVSGISAGRDSDCSLIAGDSASMAGAPSVPAKDPVADSESLVAEPPEQAAGSVRPRAPLPEVSDLPVVAGADSLPAALADGAAPTPCPPHWPTGLGGFVAGVASTALLGLCVRRCGGRAGASARAARVPSQGSALELGDAPQALPAAGAAPQALARRGSAMATLPPGAFAFVQYDDPADNWLWHERLIMGWISGAEYVVMTPDGDVFIEQLDSASRDLSGVRFSPVTRGLPAGLAGARLRRFAAQPAGADLAALLAEGASHARVKRQARGLAQPPGAGSAGGSGGVAPVAAPAPLPVVPPPAAPGALPPPPPAPRLAPAGGCWVFDVPGATRAVGQEFIYPAGALDFGGRVFVTVGSDITTGSFVAADVDLDSRVEIRLKGPPSMGDTVSALQARSPGGFMASHERWLVGDSKALELAHAVDGVNSANLTSMEYLNRRRQLLEEAHKSDPDKPNFEGAHYFSGEDDTGSGTLVAPSLRSHVAGEFAKDAAIEKERRQPVSLRGALDSDAARTLSHFQELLAEPEIRLVLDCREANQHSKRSPFTEIAAAESLSALEVPEGRQLYSACADIQCAFYQCGDIGDLRQYFCLPKVSRAEALRAGIPVKDLNDSSDFVYPATQVSPMGWSWAFRFVQRLHLEVVRRSGVPSAMVATGSWPLPSVVKGPIEVPDSDNVNAFGWILDPPGSLDEITLPHTAWGNPSERGWKRAVGFPEVSREILDLQRLGPSAEACRGGAAAAPSRRGRRGSAPPTAAGGAGGPAEVTAASPPTCEQAAVGASAGPPYQKYFEAFVEFAGQPAETLDELEVQAPSVLGAFRHAGCTKGDADYLVASAKDALPMATGPKTLPRVQRALKGCAKRVPPRSRAPAPREVVGSAISGPLSLGERDAAPQALTMFSAFTRPGALRKALVRDLLQPARAGGAMATWSLLLAPISARPLAASAEGANPPRFPTKTGTSHEAVPLDNPLWLGPLLALHARGRQGRELLFAATGVEKAVLFRRVTEAQGLQDVRLCQLRRGEAGEDALSAHRALAEVKTRGHWSQGSSLKRHAKPGMAQQLLSALSPAARAHGEVQWTRLQDLFGGRARASWPAR
ncbi:unnamed protein product [Prorocentrum cordatum]|uniref:Uncharacterized protein n=1 Tax=Prorocentrum cordatum TaxID=2364126 RepID=A0ABN9X2E2_9DINO|nr:unnamed protein product [Polarella glacialis]